MCDLINYWFIVPHAAGSRSVQNISNPEQACLCVCLRVRVLKYGLIPAKIQKRLTDKWADSQIFRSGLNQKQENAQFTDVADIA